MTAERDVIDNAGYELLGLVAMSQRLGHSNPGFTAVDYCHGVKSPVVDLARWCSGNDRNGSAKARLLWLCDVKDAGAILAESIGHGIITAGAGHVLGRAQ